MSDSSNKNSLREQALEYHEFPKRGKIEVIPIKATASQHDLSMAYTPGVAEPCKEIMKDASKSRLYTSKGNLVAVISNGTAVLGLGNIGALAGKPVMEGKGVLFKRFADIDVFDIEVNTEDADELIQTVKNIAPTFGGINLEDIKAPECFYIEETLKRELDIPVFHDDQHGTAIISGAALLNALEILGKDIADIKLVVSGAGAAGIACANFYVSLGVKLENILMTDSKGVLWLGRGDEQKNKYKSKFFRDTNARTLADAMVGADVFCGLSIKNIVSKDMVRSMSDRPIIFAMANPDPEITYPDAITANPNAIVATGRSDYPNQVNNVLGFPFIFRGTLDVESTAINEEMKLGAAKALADLAKEEVPESVKKAYNTEELSFGPNYIIPKPFDHRVLICAASAVAEAAIKTGVANKIIDIEEYKNELEERIDPSRDIMRKFHVLAQKKPKRIVFPEGMNSKVIWAASEIVREGIGEPILLAKDKNELLAKFESMNHSVEGIKIIEPKKSGFLNEFVDRYYTIRQRKGLSFGRAKLSMRNYYYFGTMMVQTGKADAMVAGLDVNFPEVIKPALEIVGTKSTSQKVSGLYFILHNNRLYAFTDCVMNINPSADDLAGIALEAAEQLEQLNISPVIAFLSFSNFGSVRTKETEKITEAVKKLNRLRPDLIADGPVQADIALNGKTLKSLFPFTKLLKQPNLLIFPNLDSANISLRMLKSFSNARHIGPILMGLNKPIHFVTRNSEVNHVIDIASIATVEAQ